MRVAFIPVRGGSKSIPLKNIKSFCGKPLVYWTIKAACECEYVDKVYVATDSEAIRQTVERIKQGDGIESFAKICVIDRSAESASDGATTESAMLEFASRYAFDDIILIQATSPMLTAKEITQGFREYGKAEVDSVLSVVRQKRFYWEKMNNGLVRPVNYDVYNRPRRQDFEGCLVENGAFYITSKELLLKSGNRVSGNISAVEMNEDSFFEIDEPQDWIIAERLMQHREKKGVENLKRIKMFLTDCDGCLTDAGMYYSENGDELKKFCARDGMGFALLREKGIITGIITGEERELNKRRADKLKINELIGGCHDKSEAVLELSRKYNIALENICYVGDDINDLGAIHAVGVSFCPADAMEAVRESASYTTKAKGGEGVIREAADRILENIHG